MISDPVQRLAGKNKMGEAPINVFFRYPNDRILSNVPLERKIIFWVWLVVPLQYYVFTQIPGGMKWQEAFSMALAVSLSMLLVFLISSALAIVPANEIGATYSDRVRAWSLAIITNWSATVTLLAASYLAEAVLLKQGNRDLVQTLLCYRDERHVTRIFNCYNYPELFSIETYAIYLVYSSIALIVLLVTVVSATRKNRSQFPVPAPRTLFVPVVTAAVLTALYSSTKISLTGG
jgi:hypothetical protein